MSPAQRQELARTAAESAAYVAESHRSCETARKHVLSSRRAIERSLELLQSSRLTQQP